MKKTAYGFLIMVLFLTAAACRADVLFSDSFNRSDNTDIDAASTGMAGLLAPLAYNECFEGSGDSSIQIYGSRLNIAVGTGMSSLFVDHNFTDAALLSARGFSVSLDVVSITNADSAADRFGGFGIGLTRDEALAAADSFDSDAPLRPAMFRADQGIGVADFYVDLALDSKLRLWSNGALLSEIPVGAASGTLRVDFSCADFNAGSPVSAVVYFNGIQQAIQSFTWDHGNANYLGISGRTVGAGVFLDNLTVSTVTQLPATILVTETDGQTVVKEGGNTDELTLSLTASPLAYPVTIDITDMLDPDQVTVSPAVVTFTSADWQTPRTVTVTAIDDADMERATHETTLAFTVTTDPASPYAGYTLADVPVLVNENDCGAWGYNPADFNLDCQVNLEDFARFVQEWVSCSIPDPQCQDYRGW